MTGMVVRISRTEEPETRRLLLRVEGALTHESAQLLGQQCVSCPHEAAWGVEIDLTAVTFIDEAAAAVVRRLSQSPGVSLTGCQLFTQQMIEAAPLWEAVRRGEGTARITPVHGDTYLGRRSDAQQPGTHAVSGRHHEPRDDTTDSRHHAGLCHHRFGEPGTLRTLPMPEIGADEILVRVHAAGVNPLDEKIRDGFKAVEGVRFPLTLGQDAAGVVVRTGPNVTRFGVGSAVYGAFWLAGTFAEYVRVPTIRVAVAYKPATLDFSQAAADALAAMRGGRTDISMTKRHAKRQNRPEERPTFTVRHCQREAGRCPDL
jgi:hypothetical protein